MSQVAKGEQAYATVDANDLPPEVLRPKRRRWYQIGLFTPLTPPQRRIVAILSVTVFVIAWEFGVKVFDVNPVFLPALSDVLASFGDLQAEGILWSNLGISAAIYLGSMAVSIVISIPIGLAIGGFKTLDRLLSPYLWALYTTPRIILLPLVLLWVGLNNWARVVLIILSAAPSIIVVVMDGVKTVDSSLLRAGRAFGASRLNMFREIVLPSTLPYVGTGIRMGVSRGLIGLFVAELFTGSSGIGYVIVISARVYLTDRVFAMLLTFVVLSVALVSLSNRLEAGLSRWRVAPEL